MIDRKPTAAEHEALIETSPVGFDEFDARTVPAVPLRVGARMVGTPQRHRTDPERSGPARIAGVPRARYKRCFDLGLITLAIVALWPVWLTLGATIAVAIRLHDGGPVLYRQARLGRGGRVFWMFKFRTMVEDAERATGPVWASRADARATPVGRVLRRFHLDELPQVVNIVRGEMSLVGPRPERPELAARIERSLPAFARRLAVRPGIAGMAQARGRFRVTPPNKLRYDRVYIDAMGPWLDVKLLVACAGRALRRGLSHAGPAHARHAGGSHAGGGTVHDRLTRPGVAPGSAVYR